MFNNGELYKVIITGESFDMIQEYLYGLSQEVIFLKNTDETERQEKMRNKKHFKQLFVNDVFIGTMVKCEFKCDRCQSLPRSRKLSDYDHRYRLWGDTDE